MKQEELKKLNYQIKGVASECLGTGIELFKDSAYNVAWPIVGLPEDQPEEFMYYLSCNIKFGVQFKIDDDIMKEMRKARLEFMEIIKKWLVYPHQLENNK